MPRDSIARALAIQALGGGIANALTVNSGGAGSASGTAYNGSAAVTISYNSIGAAPLTAPTFVGPVTVSSGLFHGAGDGQIDGNLTLGTSVANSHTINGLITALNGVTVRGGNSFSMIDAAGAVQANIFNDGTNIDAGATSTVPLKAFSYKVGASTVINSSGVLQASAVPAFAGGDVTSVGGSLALTLGAFTGDVTKASGSLATTVTKINGVALSGLATGILKNTTTTGVPSIAIAADFPTLNQNTTGSAATLTTPRTLSITGKATAAGGTFNGSADLAINITALTVDGAITPTSVASTGAVTSSSATAGIGYATGAGGTVTQITSRTTGVTLNKICGAITLVSAAGSATWNTFTVTNSAVAATDTVEICQKSGANLYNVIVTAIGAGTFNVSVSAVSGTATESPVFNFVIVKAVAA